MTQNKAVATTLTVCATNSDRVKDLPIKNGQLIFVQDKGRIAFDYKDGRVFYNQITELAKENDRTSMLSPAVGYYFVIETAVLWFYDTSWIQITSTPKEKVFIGTALPESGEIETLYVNQKMNEISVWDGTSGKYQIVADKTEIASINDNEINTLFP